MWFALVVFGLHATDVVFKMVDFGWLELVCVRVCVVLFCGRFDCCQDVFVCGLHCDCYCCA